MSSTSARQRAASWPCPATQRQELVGEQQPTVRVPPADQRLDPGDRRVGQVDLRLVVQLELVARSTASRRSESSSSRGRPGCSRFGRKTRTGSPLAFAAYIAASARRRRVSRSRPCERHHRDADAHLDLEPVVLQVVGLLDAVGEPVDGVDHVRAVVGRQQDDELVAAQPDHGVALADPGREPSRGRPQQRVAGGVPEGVVDLLEAVEVEHAEGGRSSARSRPRCAPRRGARGLRGSRRPVSVSVCDCSSVERRLLGRRVDEPQRHGQQGQEVRIDRRSRPRSAARGRRPRPSSACTTRRCR